jgi:hypothetical protein
MRTVPTRTRILVILGLALGAFGCEDNPASNEFGVELVDPLTVEHKGGQLYVIEAKANIRVDWRIEFSNLSRPCPVETRTVCDYLDDTVHQEKMALPWRPPEPLPGLDRAFLAGDSILARAVTMPVLKPDQSERAVVIFVLGQSPVPPSTQIP